MRMLISSLLALSLSIVALPGAHSGAQAAVASVAAPASNHHGRQARAKAKKKRPRPAKATKAQKTAVKKPDKAKKNDRGFEL